MREKILKKIKDGNEYIVIDPEKDILFCPICMEEMDSEGNCFNQTWFCENTKCNGYLKRTGYKQKTFWGFVEFNRNDLIKFIKTKDSTTKDVDENNHTQGERQGQSSPPRPIKDKGDKK